MNFEVINLEYILLLKFHIYPFCTKIMDPRVLPHYKLGIRVDKVNEETLKSALGGII